MKKLEITELDAYQNYIPIFYKRTGSHIKEILAITGYSVLIHFSVIADSDC